MMGAARGEEPGARGGGKRGNGKTLQAEVKVLAWRLSIGL